MLFVALFKTKTGTPTENIARRAKWQYPQGVKVIAEYWLPSSDPTVVAIYETDNTDLIFQCNVQWGDVFEMKISPAIIAERGLELAQQMMQG